MGHSNCDECGHDKRMCECDRYVAQEGGDHYQAEYQHWDWVTDIGMGYLPGNATKYVARWRKKNGEQDLLKAITYVDKMLAVRKNYPGYQFNRFSSYKTRSCTNRFTEVNNFSEVERSIMEILSGPCEKYMLELARERILDLLRASKSHLITGMGNGPSKGQDGPLSASEGVSGGIEHPAPFGYDADAEGYPERPEADFTNYGVKDN